MKNFSKQLAAILAGPAGMSQSEFANRTGLSTSKLSRLLSDTIAPDRDTLDQTLNGIPKVEDRVALVNAYFHDVASPGALLHLSGNQDPFAFLDELGMAPRDKKIFVRLMTSPHRNAVCKLHADLAAAFGLD